MRKRADYITISISFLAFAAILFITAMVAQGDKLFIEIPDICGFGISFAADGLRCVLAVAASLLWLMTSIFSPDYMGEEENKVRYYVSNIITLFATLGVFFAADLFTLFIAFEIMSIASYVFVVQEETKEAIRAAGTYLAVAVIGGLVLLMGLFLFYSETGTLAINELSAAAASAQSKGAIVAAAICMLIGFGAKAGMFPLHIWLPKAHPVAPAPASALLSGMLTKSGVFGIIIVSIYIMKGSAEWGYVLLAIACVTMFVGALLALFSTQMKRTLACSSVSQIGFILTGIAMQVLLGEEGILAVNGTILHMLNHSMFKLALFLLAGTIFMSTKKLDYNSIKGFGRKKPFLLIVYLAGALGLGGVPLFSGYISKTLIHESIVEYANIVQNTEIWSSIKTAEWVFLISGGLTVAYMLKLFVVIFVEKPANEAYADKKTQKKLSYRTIIALAVPAVMICIFGMFPKLTFEKIATFTHSFFGELPQPDVNYFSAENLKGSLISISIGIAVYFVVVRTLMIKRSKTEQGIVHDYVDRWPKWMDLEDSIYRPLLMHFIPFVISVPCRIMDRFIDGFSRFVQGKALQPVPKRTPVPAGTRFSHAVGIVLDDIAAFLNHTILRKRPIKKSFVDMVEVSREAAGETGKLITRSISFALLLFCLGLLFTLVYLLSITS